MRRLLSTFVLLGCRNEPVTPPSTPDPLDTSTPTADTGDPSTTADTSTVQTGDTGAGPIVDCAAIPDAPISVTQLDAPRGYHDVVFDPLGNLLGYDGNVLLSVASDGTSQVFLPGVDTVHGMDWLPGGDLVFADDLGRLVRVTPEGGASVVASTQGVYGVTVGSDGRVYTGSWVSVERTDPDTGERTAIVQDPRFGPYVVDFSPDQRTLYVGTVGGDGSVWAVPLDAALEPVGPPEVFATGVGTGSLHDGLAVDHCGNVYVLDFDTSDLYRITPAGEVTTLLDFDSRSYGHGLEWGSGIGGWRSDALYLPQPYDGNRVVEVVIGVPSREWTGTTWPP